MDKPAKSVKTLKQPLSLKLMRLAFRIGSKIMPGTMACLAYKIWITPPRFSQPDTEKALASNADSRSIIINQHEIITYHWGENENARSPRVLLIHGWSGRGTQLSTLAKPLVEAGFRVTSFDAPAHGKSSGKTTNLLEIAHTINIIDQTFGPFESIITHSFGGPCLAMAMKQGLSTHRVVNIAPPAETPFLVKSFSKVLGLTNSVETRLMNCIEQKYGEDIWDETSMYRNIGHLDLPALVIHDKDDTDVPLLHGKTIAQAWKNSRFIETTGLGHRRILRDPDVIQTTIDFVKTGNLA